jgi:FKBP-type peptidyl-prolyl cis-trans isomerase FkpA
MATKTTMALVLVMATAGCSKLGIGGGGSPKNDDEQTPYALGMMIGRSLGDFDLTPRELDLVKAGLSDVVNKKKKPTELEKFDSKVQALRRTRMTARSVVEKEQGKKAVEAAARESGAIRTASGMVMRTTKPGTGTVSPVPTDKVKVHYVGRLLDGTEFDSSRKRGQPAEFPLNGVIPCWTEGVGKMKVGEVATLTCPAEIAYGDGGRPPTIPGGATLVFDVELLEIPAAAPGGASAPPAMPAAPHPGH